jgi:hypothetical protein
MKPALCAGFFVVYYLHEQASKALQMG